ncbi:MAG: SRPBCC family protein [Ilumatobacteraceae bacterium]
MSEERVTVRARINAPAARVFAIVSDPAGHVAIDGSGMLEPGIDAVAPTAGGDTFDMAMDRTPLNDIPGLVKYTVRNTVTVFEPGRHIEWTIGGVDSDPLGHVYGFVVTPVSDTSCDVEHYCDWSNIVPSLRAAGREWPIVPASMLEQTLVRLEAEANR